MRYLIIFNLIVFSSIVFSGFSQELQEAQVPKIVIDSFQKQYPTAKAYQWEWKKKKKVYEAEFIWDNKRYEAHYTATGIWVKTEREVKKNQIPPIVWDSFSKTTYASWKIKDQEEHQTPQYPLVYEIKVKQKKKKVYLYFLADGKLIEEKINEEDD